MDRIAELVDDLLSIIMPILLAAGMLAMLILIVGLAAWVLIFVYKLLELF